MADDLIQIEHIVEKLKNGELFGLFEDGHRCYFQDGQKVNYTDLWKALRVVHNITGGNTKTLDELCPETFVGVHPYKPSRHNWKKKPAKPTETSE
jgi:hypothetical protein